MIYSVIIPTKDGAETLPALLAALATQKTDAQVEILAIDSGSRDGSVALLKYGSPIPTSTSNASRSTTERSTGLAMFSASSVVNTSMR